MARRKYVCSILKNQAIIVEKYESNASSKMQRSFKMCRTYQFGEVNDLLYDWYLMAVRKNIYPDGPKLSQLAKNIA